MKLFIIFLIAVFSFFALCIFSSCTKQVAQPGKYIFVYRCIDSTFKASSLPIFTPLQRDSIIALAKSHPKRIEGPMCLNYKTDTIFYHP